MAKEGEGRKTTKDDRYEQVKNHMEGGTDLVWNSYVSTP